MTRREGVLAYLATLLTGTAGITSRLYRSRAVALAQTERPAILFEFMDEVASYPNLNYVDSTMRVRVGIIVEGAITDSLADPIFASSYALIMADRTLGNRVMDVYLTNTSFQFFEGSDTVGIMDCIYECKYRANASNMEAIS